MQAAFVRAGFFTPCVWTPQPGGLPVGGLQVDFRSPTLQAGDGEGVITVVPTAAWPRGQYARARRGDRLDITCPESGVVLAFCVRELHRVGASGDEMLAELQEWPRA